MSLQHERERCAHDRRTAAKLNAIAKEIRTARDFADVASDATKDPHAAVSTLLVEISNRLTQAADAIDLEARQEVDHAA